MACRRDRQRLRRHDGRARAGACRLARADARAGRLGGPRPPQLGAPLGRTADGRLLDGHALPRPRRRRSRVDGRLRVRGRPVGLLRGRLAALPRARLRARSRDRRRQRSRGGPSTTDELEPYYARAERLLGWPGDDGGDPTAPAPQRPLPAPAGGALRPPSRRISEAARRIWASSRSACRSRSTTGTRAAAGPAPPAGPATSSLARSRPRTTWPRRCSRSCSRAASTCGHGRWPSASETRRTGAWRGRVRRPRQRPPYQTSRRATSCWPAGRSPRRTWCWPRGSTA